MPIVLNPYRGYGNLSLELTSNEGGFEQDVRIAAIQVNGQQITSLRSPNPPQSQDISTQLFESSSYTYTLNDTTLHCNTLSYPWLINIQTWYKDRGQFYSITPIVNDDVLQISFNSTGTAAAQFDSKRQGLTSLYQAYLNGANLQDLSQETTGYYSERDIAGLDERLTEVTGTYQVNYNLFLQYLSRFKDYWEKDNKWVGRAYAELREIGLLSDATITDIWIGQQYSQSCTKHFTAETAAALNYLQIQSFDDGGIQKYSREDCIQHVAIIAAKLTEYWNLAHTAATTIGLFIPETWDCVAQLEQGNLPLVYTQQLPLLTQNHYDVEHWTAAPEINSDVVPLIQLKSSARQHRQFKFYNSNKMYEQPLALYQNTQTGATHYTNTNNYYKLLISNSAEPDSLNYDDSRYWYLAQEQHKHNVDTTSAYYAKIAYAERGYDLTQGRRRTPASILAQWLGPKAKIMDVNTDIGIDWTDMHYNPNISFLTWLAQSREYNDAKYYTLREEHDKLWHHLHEAYPGVFRESNYVNQDASTPLELYNASKRELEASCQPQFSYSLTGMDIYMHDSDYNPMQLQVTDQIRIDYQEDIHGADTLGKALREPLYVTGIRHSLRNDGDYQFDVTTRKGTDVMMQRFAQLLNFGN